MWIGIGVEKGKRIRDTEAFGYACDRCRYGDEEERNEFMDIFRKSSDIEEFANTLVEWFFSGNWIYDERDNGKQSWIVRFSDKTLHSFYGTYEEAVLFAREMVKENGMGFVVS